MSVIRIALTILVLGGLVIFVLQNLSPVLPLVFLGSKTLALPVVVWIFLFAAAGLVTSFFGQFLNYLQRQSSSGNYRAREPKPQPPRPSQPFFQEEQEAKERAAKDIDPLSPESTNNSTIADSEWESGGNDDWSFAEAAAQSTAKEDKIWSSNDPEVEEFEDWDAEPTTTAPKSERNSTTFQKPQTSRQTSKSDSVYSYSYRDAEDSGTGKTEQVYDANYRVITPPYRQETPDLEEDDQDDWGF